MIPNAAIAAAERAIRKEMESQAYDRHTYTQAALEAAAPYLRAQALEDAADELAKRAGNVRNNTHIESELFVALTFRSEVLDDAAGLLRARAVTERGEG